MDVEELQELMQEEWDYGGITIYCECGNSAFVELDGEGWCEDCEKKIPNPFIEMALI